MSKLLSLMMSFIWVGTAFGAKLVWIETLTSPMFNDGMIWPTGKARYLLYRFYFQKIKQYLCFLFQKLFKSKSKVSLLFFKSPKPFKIWHAHTVGIGIEKELTWLADFYLLGIQMVANWKVRAIWLATLVKSLVTKYHLITKFFTFRIGSVERRSEVVQSKVVRWYVH